MSVDFSIPREYIPWDGKGAPGPCPRCGGTLQQENATYMVLTRRGNKIMDSFITNSREGWFCTQCPALLINPQSVAGIFSHPLPGKWDLGEAFAIEGIVNLNAIPKNKQHLPLGAANNPIPLVLFTNVSTAAAPDPRPASPTQRSRAKRRKGKR